MAPPLTGSSVIPHPPPKDSAVMLWPRSFEDASYAGTD
jgi:hypothetical protein